MSEFFMLFVLCFILYYICDVLFNRIILFKWDVTNTVVLNIFLLIIFNI